MDRLDYLIRDSQATGVPYGLVDIHYLLNHVRRSESGADAKEPVDIVEIEHSILHEIGSYVFHTSRLYLIREDDKQEGMVEKLQAEVAKWDK